MWKQQGAITITQSKIVDDPMCGFSDYFAKTRAKFQGTSTSLRDDRGKRSPTSRLHTDRIKVIGWVREIVAAGEAERYTVAKKLGE